MTRSRLNPWMSLSLDAWSLGVEASSVIGLRTVKIAFGGPEAAVEMHRMVAEKVEAVAALQGKAMTGALGLSPDTVAARTISHYRRKVVANHRRLSKG